MSDLPEGLTHEGERELRGRGLGPWGRRAALLAILGFVALALANVFGQRATTSTGVGPAAALSVDAPDRLRGGVIAQATIRVAAIRRVARARIALERGWLEGMTINTITPEPADQQDAGGGVVLAYGEIPAGEGLTVRIQFQVNPTRLGRAPQGVELRDGDAALAHVRRTVTVFP